MDTSADFCSQNLHLKYKKLSGSLLESESFFGCLIRKAQ